MRQFYNDANKKDYFAGYDAKIAEIRGMGWHAARDKFNLDNPLGLKPANIGAFYYATGEIDALVNEIPSTIANDGESSGEIP